MRRGTKAAEVFGQQVREIRERKGMTMRAVAAKLPGEPAAAYVSQVEKAQRVVKEDKLEVWAYALGVSHTQLRRLWLTAERSYPAPAITRKKGKSQPKSKLLARFDELNSTERMRVLGYMDALVEARS